MRRFVLVLLVLTMGGIPNINGWPPWFEGPTISTLVVHPAQVFGSASPYLIGGNLLTGSSNIQLTTHAQLAGFGINVLRYPQGTVGNCIHWATNSCPSTPPCNITQNVNSTDAAFVALMGTTIFGHVVVNEATNAACSAGNTTADVLGMLNDIIVTQGCPITQCIWWTIDNEQYNSGALTLSCTPNSNQDCYQVQFTSFQTAMLGQNPGIKVCLDADPQKSGPQGATWDAHVMIGTFGCADAHYYFTQSGLENDQLALYAPQNDFTPNFMAQLHTDLAASGSPTAQIIIGEYSTVPSNYSVQTQSIVQALFNAGMVGEASQDGVTSLQFHAAVANCQPVVVQSGVYGQWLTFTGSQSISNGSAGGTCNGVSGQPPAGTVLAPGSGLQVAADYMQGCVNIIKSTLSTAASSDVAQYSCALSSGYSLMFINRSETTSHTITVSIDGHPAGAGGAIVQYSKAIFDLTNNVVSPTWDGPVTSGLAPWTNNFTITIPPWSVTSVQTG